MRRIAPFMFVFALVWITAACRQQPASAPTATPAPATLPPTAAPTATPAPRATATPPPAPTEPAVEAPPPSFCERIDPSLIELNTQGLPYEWQVNCVPGEPYGSDGPYVGGMPEHIQINFGGLSPDARQLTDPVLYVMPADDYRKLWDDAGNPLVGEQLDALAEWIGRQPEAVRTRDMPVLPIVEAQATNDLAVQGKYLDFGAWDGLRFVARFAQGPMPITNEGLRYIFQGFAGENDELFVAFFYPVTSPQLPLTGEEVTADEMSALEADPLGYFDARSAELNALTAADWQPGLDVLDAVVGSLQYGGSETAAEAPTIAPEAKRSQPASYAIVNGASGVNVRTGPSTAYPSLGIAPFGMQLELIGRSLDGHWWVTPIIGAPSDRGWVNAGFVDVYNTGALPVMAAPPPPAPPPATPAPIPPSTDPSIAFWVDRGTINQGECTTLRWSVANIQAVWVYPVGQPFERYPVTGDGSRNVCPAQTTIYEMRVQLRDGSVTTRQVTVNVNPGNTLAGSQWVLAGFGGGQALAPGAPPTLFLGSGNYTEGFGGCNPFSGNYSVSGTNGIAISVASRGGRTCGPELDEQEARMLSALQGAGAYEIAGNQLILRDTAGVETLRFLRR